MTSPMFVCFFWGVMNDSDDVKRMYSDSRPLPDMDLSQTPRSGTSAIFRSDLTMAASGHPQNKPIRRKSAEGGLQAWRGWRGWRGWLCRESMDPSSQLKD